MGVRLGGSFVDSLMDMVWVVRVGVEMALVMGFTDRGLSKVSPMCKIPNPVCAFLWSFCRWLVSGVVEGVLGVGAS